MGFNIYGPPGAVLPTGSRLTSSIHISPTSISPTILNSRINLVASGSVWTMRSILGPAADRLQTFLEASLMELAPGDRCVFVLRDPNAALALGSGGDQIPESQSHLGVIAHGALLVAIRLMAQHVGLEMQTVGTGDEVPRVAAILREVQARCISAEPGTVPDPAVRDLARPTFPASSRRCGHPGVDHNRHRGCVDARSAAGGASCRRGPS